MDDWSFGPTFDRTVERPYTVTTTGMHTFVIVHRDTGVDARLEVRLVR